MISPRTVRIVLTGKRTMRSIPVRIYDGSDVLADRLRRLPRAPADRGCDLARDRLEHRGVVLDAELAGNGQEDRVCGLDRGIMRECVGDPVGLAGVGAAEAAGGGGQPADPV